ncbi:MAG: alpha/beta fold hydrolase [Pseudomonadota bacterium]
MKRRDAIGWVIGALAAVAIVVALLRLEAPYAGLIKTNIDLEGTPVSILAPDGDEPAPAVVIAHGFAGSRQLMEPFAVTLARNGYVAVSFDFRGHGRNRLPLVGDVTTEDGATAALLEELRRVIAYARFLPWATGEVAILGHSMASDIIVRASVTDPEIAATVAVSMFTREVTAKAPKNLLVIVGEYEGFLATEALKAVALSAQTDAFEGVTYGSFDDGSARRAVLADGTEHVTVLFSQEALTEAVGWLDQVFGRTSTGAIDARGIWFGLLMAGVIALIWVGTRRLPRFEPRAQALSNRRFLALCIVPAIITPLVLWPLPTGFLPVLVADYLAVHFALFGALTCAGLLAFRAVHVAVPTARFVLTVLAASAVAIFAIAVPIDAYIASFMPGPDRIGLIAVLAVGTLSYTCSDEILTGRPGARWWWYPVSKLSILASLAIAVALDLESLFFLIIILPVIVLFFILYGLFSRWMFRATQAPMVPGIALGLAFAWALGVTFPLLQS